MFHDAKKCAPAKTLCDSLLLLLRRFPKGCSESIDRSKLGHFHRTAALEALWDLMGVRPSGKRKLAL